MINLLMANLEPALKLGVVGAILLFVYKVYSWYQSLKRREAELLIKDTEVKLDGVKKDFQTVNLLELLKRANERMDRRDKTDPKK